MLNKDDYQELARAFWKDQSESKQENREPNPTLLSRYCKETAAIARSATRKILKDEVLIQENASNVIVKILYDNEGYVWKEKPHIGYINTTARHLALATSAKIKGKSREIISGTCPVCNTYHTHLHNHCKKHLNRSTGEPYRWKEFLREFYHSNMDINFIVSQPLVSTVSNMIKSDEDDDNDYSYLASGNDSHQSITDDIDSPYFRDIDKKKVRALYWELKKYPIEEQNLYKDAICRMMDYQDILEKYDSVSTIGAIKTRVFRFKKKMSQMLMDRFPEDFPSEILSESKLIRSTPNGSLQVNFKDDAPNGRFTKYYDSGIIKEEGNMDNGELHGYFASYDKSGNLVESGKYKRGYKHGNWTSVYRDEFLVGDEYQELEIKETFGYYMDEVNFYKLERSDGYHESKLFIDDNKPTILVVYNG